MNCCQQAGASTDFESYAEAMQATLTDLGPEQMEAILPAEAQEGIAKVETADGVFEDGMEKEEEGEVEGEEEEEGLLHEREELLYTGESM
jgi:hypothetical protein